MCDRLTKMRRALLLRDNALEAEKALRKSAAENLDAFEADRDPEKHKAAVSMLEDAEFAAHEAAEYGRLAARYESEEDA